MAVAIMTALCYCPGCDDVRCECQPAPESMESVVFGRPLLTVDIVHPKGLGRWVVVKEVDTERVWGEPIKCINASEAMKALHRLRLMYGLDGQS
jgi:hypothetical protein